MAERQTYLYWSPVHYSPENRVHSDVQLKVPSFRRDYVLEKIAHVPFHGQTTLDMFKKP